MENYFLKLLLNAACGIFHQNSFLKCFYWQIPQYFAILPIVLIFITFPYWFLFFQIHVIDQFSLQI